MPTFVEMNCVKLLAGSRVEMSSSYSRNSVLLNCWKRLLSFQHSSVLWCSAVSNVELESITQTIQLDCGGE